MVKYTTHHIIYSHIGITASAFHEIQIKLRHMAKDMDEEPIATSKNLLSPKVQHSKNMEYHRQ